MTGSTRSKQACDKDLPGVRRETGPESLSTRALGARGNVTPPTPDGVSRRRRRSGGHPPRSPPVGVRMGQRAAVGTGKDKHLPVSQIPTSLMTWHGNRKSDFKRCFTGMVPAW